MECPECGATLGTRAKYCPCGWKYSTETATKGKGEYTRYPPQGPCSHDGCFAESLCKIKTPNGWANLCERHYQQYHQAIAEATCGHLGLETTAQKREWLRKHYPNMAAFDTGKAPREPGEDWQEEITP